MTRSEIDKRLLAVCRIYHPSVTVQAVLGRSRKRHVVAARHFWWALQFHNGRTMSAIARKEGRNHTGIMHGIRRAEDEWGANLFARLVRYERPRPALRGVA